MSKSHLIGLIRLLTATLRHVTAKERRSAALQDEIDLALAAAKETIRQGTTDTIDIAPLAEWVSWSILSRHDGAEYFDDRGKPLRISQENLIRLIESLMMIAIAADRQEKHSQLESLGDRLIQKGALSSAQPHQGRMAFLELYDAVLRGGALSEREGEIDHLLTRVGLATRYTFGKDQDPHGQIHVSYRGNGRWVVERFGECYNRESIWVVEPSPSNRSEEFIQQTRYDLDEALRLAKSLFRRV